MNRLSIVVPCYNEEEVLIATSEQLIKILKDLISENIIDKTSFILYIDDGSTDSTWSLIKSLHKGSANIYGLKLASNTGHQNALLAGLMKAKDICDFAISIDADLQDDANVIKTMVKEHKSGYDIVYGIRAVRDSDSYLKRVTAQAFYKLMNGLGTKTIYNHADFRLMSRRSLEFLSGFEERNLFLRGIVPTIGYSSTSVYYERTTRLAGESKYSFSKMVNFAIDGITSFSIKPLRMIFVLGFSILILFSFALVYTLLKFRSSLKC